ncbi:hypothetical protein L3Q82_020828, partial [Scortum barcoo]
WDRLVAEKCAKPKEGKPPRLMVIRVTLFQVKNDVLHRAGEDEPLLYNGKRVHILPDFTPTVAKQRAAFIKVKKELHACTNFRFGLRYPATLHITIAGKHLDPDSFFDKISIPIVHQTMAEALERPITVLELEAPLPPYHFRV